MKQLSAGTGVRDISPAKPQFLYGYPHVERYSSGIHDPLQSTALYLNDGGCEICFISNDIIFVDKAVCAEIRRRVHNACGIPAENIMVTATHTHSGPVTASYISNKNDPVVPPPDPEYIERFIQGAAEAAVEAKRTAVLSELGTGCARVDGVGGNRRDPAGPRDPEVPILLVRNTAGTVTACMLVYSMHPTVLHEDSTLISGDFPAAARAFLQKEVLGSGCPVIYHTGPEGNQSTRHEARANSFAEAERLGSHLGQQAAEVLSDISFSPEVPLQARREMVDLPRRRFPDTHSASKMTEEARRRFRRLQAEGAAREEVRTAECDWFGAEETLALAQAAAGGMLDRVYQSFLPAEIQVLSVGGRNYAGWPGEVFVEYGLELKKRLPNTYPICLANGILQGYVVTEEAAEEGGYEASNALIHWSGGNILVDRTVELCS